MAEVAVYNTKGEQVGKMELNDSIFSVEINKIAMHTAVVQYLANQRQGTKSTLTRAEVSGGGKKPWRQKGTGRARQGSIRSPQWIHGGVVFAPKPRDFSFKVNRKVKRIALQSALSTKLSEQKIIVLDALTMPQIKTKEMKKVLDAIKAPKALVCLADADKNIQASARNLEGVKTASVNTINVYDLIKFDTLVVTKQAVEKIQEVYA